MNTFPVCVFAFNRPKHTEQTLKALSQNFLAGDTDVYVFVDGPRVERDEVRVKKVREIVSGFHGFRSIRLKFREKNIGLSRSIINGVTEVLGCYDGVIVLEDDLITQPNFLNFMNQALLFYKDSDKVGTVCGFSHDLGMLEKWNSDVYFGHRPSSWGWGTWQRTWFSAKWEHAYYWRILKNPLNWIRLYQGGSDVPYMLFNQLLGRIDSWAIRWACNQMMEGKLAVFPAQSLVYNNGIDEFATHTKRSRRFSVKIDLSSNVHFGFSEKIEENKALMRDFRKQYSLTNRLRDRML